MDDNRQELREKIISLTKNQLMSEFSGEKIV
jgi:hypothetical protein